MITWSSWPAQTQAAPRSRADLSHEEDAAVVEDLGVVGTLGQGVQPHADRLLSAPVPDVKVGQGVSQRARLGTQLQQRLAQGHAVVEPAAAAGWEPRYNARRYGEGGVRRLTSPAV